MRVPQRAMVLTASPRAHLRSESKTAETSRRSGASSKNLFQGCAEEPRVPARVMLLVPCGVASAGMFRSVHQQTSKNPYVYRRHEVICGPRPSNREYVCLFAFCREYLMRALPAPQHPSKTRLFQKVRVGDPPYLLSTQLLGDLVQSAATRHGCSGTRGIAPHLGNRRRETCYGQSNPRRVAFLRLARAVVRRRCSCAPKERAFTRRIYAMSIIC